MLVTEKTACQGISLPAHVARPVKSLAKSGIAVRKQEKKRFFELANRLEHSRGAEDQRRLKAELTRLTFGE